MPNILFIKIIIVKGSNRTSKAKMESKMSELDKAETWKYAEKSLAWSGWGSPVGLGFFLLAIGVSALLIRYAWFLH